MHLRILPQSLILTTTTIIVAPSQQQKYKQNPTAICRLLYPDNYQMTNLRGCHRRDACTMPCPRAVPDLPETRGYTYPVL